MLLWRFFGVKNKGRLPGPFLLLFCVYVLYKAVDSLQCLYIVYAHEHIHNGFSYFLFHLRLNPPLLVYIILLQYGFLLNFGTISNIMEIICNRYRINRLFSYLTLLLWLPILL
nr:MAG TPA: hypothetical protein [Caudoviricetes sp.]DAO07633.1 MAG TPA: hypothetical protein [Caudoviricetes sp.]